MDDSIFDRFPEGGLIKTVDEPNAELGSAEKARLNRRGNELYNKGEFEFARRIFQTTGYSDGLIRVGEKYLESGKPVEALKMFKLAHDPSRSEELVRRAAQAIQKLLTEEENE